MYQLCKNNPLNFSLLWIGIYCVVQSLANGISEKIGIDHAANAVFALLQSIFMLWWLRKNGLLTAFRLKKPDQPAKKMLFYLPLLLISTTNLWLGVGHIPAPAQLGVHVLLMLCVGFLEELIVRGFLFEALRKDSLKTAVAVSSLAFGAGHLLNLFNGSGMTVGAVLLQIGFAVLIGFLFVMVMLRSGSLIPCIVSHQTINLLSIFANRQAPAWSHLAVNLAEIAIILLYLLTLRKTAPIPQSDS